MEKSFITPFKIDRGFWRPKNRIMWFYRSNNDKIWFYGWIYSFFSR